MNERLKRGISLVEAEARALVPAQPGKMKTIKWLGIKAPAEKPEEFKMKIPDTVQTTPETANKLKEARQIMGGRLILPDAVESALGTRIDRRLVNHFPFSEEQLKRLSRDSVVMYFADETETGQPITMRWLEEIKAAKVKRIFKSLITKGREIINSDYTQTPDNRYAGHEFYESQTPRPGWRSFTVNVVPESKNKDALGQTDALIDHLKSKTFKDITLPEDIQSAVKDYYSKKRQIRDVMIKDPVEATRLLMDLDLIKFTRVTAVELSYASHVLSEVYQRRFLAFERSTTLSCDTRYPEVFTIGNFDLQPDKSISAKESVLPVHPKRRYPDTGAVLSVGADALPTPPQTEETKLSNTSQDQALIKHAATPISFDRQIANNLLFEYRLKQEKLPFDPERDITDNDWKGMTEALVKVREEMDISPYGYSEYLQLLHRMRVLCPKKFSMIDSSMLPKEKDFDFISGYNKKQMLGYALERTEGFTYAHQYMTEASLLLRQAFPDKTQPWDEKKLQQTYQSIVEYNNSKVSYDLGMLARLNILFPNWISENFLNEHNTKRENVQSSINTNFYILSAEKIMEDEANFRILTGDNNHRLDWDIIKQAINSARTEGRNRTFARLCELAMILAAEEVKITDKGLEINMRKPEKKSAPAILTDRKSDSEPVFDPERDIPDSEQLGMFNEMDDLRRESNSILISRNSSQAFPINTHRKYIAYALSFRRLFPETFQAIQKENRPKRDHYDQLADDVKDSAKRLDDHYNIGDSPVRDAIESAMLIREFFFPKRNTGLEEHKDLLERIVQKEITSSRPADYIRILAELNIIFPNLITQNYGEHFTPEMMRARYSKATENQNVLYFLKDEAAYRIITGNKCPFVNGRKIKEAIEWGREKKDYGYLSMIYESLLISTAEEVRVTDSGLIVNARKPVKSNMPIAPQWTF